MTPERWQQVKDILGGALQKEPEERAAFLAQACQTDPALRSEVESLLASGSGLNENLLPSASPDRIALKKGVRLGPYEIVTLIGAGGMGEVYRAVDTRLDRDVAIKVLPSSLSRSAERQQRFRREARAISSLQHPNICTLFDIGEHDGIDYLVMEYLEGESLAARLQKGRLGLDLSLRYAAEVSDALDSAHRRGIVHRDVKPANIFITSRGEAKVLDFGLAKLGDQKIDEAATATAAALQVFTMPGVAMGTAAYMSPEQARGEELDSRTDIFSLAAVLYEMLTGNLAFPGKTPATMFKAILDEMPPAPSQIVPSLPAQVDLVIDKALEKDRDLRYQSAADFRSDLNRLKRDASSGRAFATAVDLKLNPTSVKERAGSRMKWLLAGVAGLLAVAIIGVFWLIRHNKTEPAARIRLIPLTSYPGMVQQPSLSPDGSQVAFSWNGPDQKNFDIYIKTTGMNATGAPALRLTTDPADDINPVWSPDGSSIAFLRNGVSQSQSTVILISALGGSERKLADVTLPDTNWFSPPYLTWMPDSQSLVVADRAAADRPFSLYLLSASTGEKRQVTFPPPKVAGDHCPAVSPDGKALIFRRANPQGQWSGVFNLVSLGEDSMPRGEPHPIRFAPTKSLPNGSTTEVCAAWTADSRRLLFPFDLGLWTLPISFNNGNIIQGQATMAVETGDGVNWPSISRVSSRLAYARISGGADSIWRLRIPADGEKPMPPVPLIASTKPDFAAQYSPDGKKIVFESERSGHLEIWGCGSDGANCNQLTSIGAGATGTPAWSPDGAKIAFYSNAEGKSQIFVMAADGGARQRVTSVNSNAIFSRWSRDGEWIYFSSKDSGTSQIWKVRSGGGEMLQVTHGGGSVSSETPDGKWLYFTRDEGAESSLWRMPVGGGPENRVLPHVHNFNFSVVDDGIYFVAKNEGGSAIAFLAFATGKVRVIAPIPAGYFGLSVSPDRKWILYPQQTRPDESQLFLAEGFR